MHHTVFAFQLCENRSELPIESLFEDGTQHSRNRNVYVFRFHITPRPHVLHNEFATTHEWCPLTTSFCDVVFQQLSHQTDSLRTPAILVATDNIIEHLIAGVDQHGRVPYKSCPALLAVRPCIREGVIGKLQRATDS